MNANEKRKNQLKSNKSTSQKPYFSSFSIFLLCVCVFCPSNYFFFIFHIYTYAFHSIQNDLSLPQQYRATARTFLDNFIRIFIYISIVYIFHTIQYTLSKWMENIHQFEFKYCIIFLCILIFMIWISAMILHSPVFYLYLFLTQFLFPSNCLSPVFVPVELLVLDVVNSYWIIFCLSFYHKYHCIIRITEKREEEKSLKLNTAH